MATYDPSNVFAKILRGELPSHTVYEDDATIAIMDIMPRADGHVLAIPKAACRNVFDAPPEALKAVSLTVQRLARAVKGAFLPTASPSSSSTRPPADKSCSTCTSTSSRASTASR